MNSLPPRATLHGGLMMKVLPILLLVIVSMAWMPVASAHGGGCRKSSPPGKCCHMDKKRGEVHCH